MQVAETLDLSELILQRTLLWKCQLSKRDYKSLVTARKGVPNGSSEKRPDI